MRYNLRVKEYPNGSLQFMHFSYMQDSVRKPKRYTGEHVERGKIGDIKRTIREVYDLAKSNEWDWFITLTFNPDVVDSFDYEAVTKAMCKFTDVMRKRGYKYIIVPELHEKGRYHFHGLVSGNLPCTEAVNPYTGKLIVDNKGRQVYNIDIYKYGFTQATRIDETLKAACYLTKYLSKDLAEAVPKGKKRYWASRSLARPAIDYDVVNDKQFATIFTEARYRKQIITEYGKFSLAEY